MAHKTATSSSYGGSYTPGRNTNLFSSSEPSNFRYGSTGGYRPYSSYSTSSGPGMSFSTSPLRGSDYHSFSSTGNPSSFGFGHVTTFPKATDTRTSTSSTGFANASGGASVVGAGGMYSGIGSSTTTLNTATTPPRFSTLSMGGLTTRQREAQVARNLAKVEAASLQVQTEDGWVLAENRELELDGDSISKLTAKDKQADKDVKLRWAPRSQAAEPKEGSRCIGIATVVPVAQAVLGQIAKYRENCATAQFLSNLLEELSKKDIPKDTVLAKTIDATNQIILELGSEIDAEGGVSGFLSSVTKWGKEFALAQSVEKQLCKCVTQLQTAMLCHSLK